MRCWRRIVGWKLLVLGVLLIYPIVGRADPQTVLDVWVTQSMRQDKCEIDNQIWHDPTCRHFIAGYLTDQIIDRYIQEHPEESPKVQRFDQWEAKNYTFYNESRNASSLLRNRLPHMQWSATPVGPAPPVTRFTIVDSWIKSHTEADEWDNQRNEWHNSRRALILAVCPTDKEVLEFVQKHPEEVTKLQQFDRWEATHYTYYRDSRNAPFVVTTLFPITTADEIPHDGFKVATFPERSKGYQALLAKDYATALRIFSSCAGAGDAYCEATYAYMLHNELGLRPVYWNLPGPSGAHFAEANVWYRRAAAHGNVLAQHVLESHSFEDIVFPPDGFYVTPPPGYYGFGIAALILLVEFLICFGFRWPKAVVSNPHDALILAQIGGGVDPKTGEKYFRDEKGKKRTRSSAYAGLKLAFSGVVCLVAMLYLSEWANQTYVQQQYFNKYGSLVTTDSVGGFFLVAGYVGAGISLLLAFLNTIHTTWTNGITAEKRLKAMMEDIALGEAHAAVAQGQSPPMPDGPHGPRSPVANPMTSKEHGDIQL